ncbi:MAG: hypothetical protein EZS28_036363, partial [Streblomastix strix]
MIHYHRLLKINDKYFKDEEIEYAGGDEQKVVTETFYNNHITTPEDYVIQRSEVIIDPDYFGRDLIEALYSGRIRYKPYNTTALTKYRTPMEVKQDSVSNKQVTYRIRLADEKHVQNLAPTILYSRKSINEFKQYVRSSIIQMQERTKMKDIKEFIVAIYSLEVISYRIPFPGKNMEELIKIHKSKKNIIKHIHSDDDYNICFRYNLTYIPIPDSKRVEINHHSRIAEGKRLLFEFYKFKKENQREFLKNYPGFNWDDSLKICQKFNVNINCYEFVDKNVEIPYKLFTNYHIDNQQVIDHIIILLNDDEGNQHLMDIISVVKLLNIRFCQVCNNRAVLNKDPNNSKRKLDTHIKDQLQKTPGYQYPILIPAAVASTIKAKNYIKTISCDNSQQDFVEKWLDQ